MTARDLSAIAQTKYDLIVVGGGIYGAMLALEASGRGLGVLLIEQNDFGSATSFNSLRIVHGGLRYLQSLDALRFYQSIRERRWFLKTFPDLVKPIGCLMPLYNSGLKRKSILRVALQTNDVLSCLRNKGVPVGSQIPGSKVLGLQETVDLFPEVDRRNLKGSAVWYDAAMPDSQRILVETLRWAVAQGAKVINYARANKIIARNGKVEGVIAEDRTSGELIDFRAPVIINSTGPWSRRTAKEFDKDFEDLFRPSIAWNILLKRKALSELAVAVSPPGGGHVYFLHPWKGRILAGTGHRQYVGSIDQPRITGDDLRQTLADLNAAIPGLMLTSADVEYVFSGLLPAAATNRFRLAGRPVIIKHDKFGGPSGLVSVSGVKFTTARLVASETLNTVCGKMASHSNRERRPEPRTGWSVDPGQALDNNPEHVLRGLREIADEEWVERLDDLVIRRTTLWEDTQNLSLILPGICDLFPWDANRKAKEIERISRSTESILVETQDVTK